MNKSNKIIGTNKNLSSYLPSDVLLWIYKYTESRLLPYNLKKPMNELSKNRTESIQYIRYV